MTICSSFLHYIVPGLFDSSIPDSSQIQLLIKPRAPGAESVYLVLFHLLIRSGVFDLQSGIRKFNICLVTSVGRLILVNNWYSSLIKVILYNEVAGNSGDETDQALRFVHEKVLLV